MKEICVFEGDGASPEAVNPTCNILRELSPKIEVVKPELDYEKLEQFIVPENVKEGVDKADAVLFGATSTRSVALLVYLRWEKETYVNVRPVKYISGFNSPLKKPDEIDYVIVRENLEGLYPSREGEIEMLRESIPDFEDIFGNKVSDLGDGKFAIRVITKEGTERVADFACRLAEQREGKIACFTKSNMLLQSCGLFKDIVNEKAEENDLGYNHFHIDDGANQLVRNPENFDVIITSNLFGDIISDVGAATIGGLGVAPSGCYGDDFAYFEPVHGTAPDLEGKNLINPTGTILSAKMMLEYIGLEDKAEELEMAVRQVYEAGRTLPRDQGGDATTTEFAEELIEYL